MNSLEKYAKQVKRHLYVDRKTKKRIIEGLMAEFEYALSNGETENEILTRMGAASQMAADYNSSYKNDPDYQANRKYAICQDGFHCLTYLYLYHCRYRHRAAGIHNEPYIYLFYGRCLWTS